MTTTLFGYQSDAIEIVRTAIERILGTIFHCEETAYRTCYVARSVDGTPIILQQNMNPLDSELMEEDYPAMRILLYLSTPCADSRIEQQLIEETGACLLNRRETD
jgi:hypothetical protein